MMRWRIRRIVNGCAAQHQLARQDVIAPEFISCGTVILTLHAMTSQHADGLFRFALRSSATPSLNSQNDQGSS